MKKLLVILGPTATGKTDLALKIAKKFNGELVSCDSRQVYVGLDIWTGKLPSKPTDLVWTFKSRPGVVIRKENGWWEVGGVRIWTVSYTHLTLPTTPYV